MSDYIHYRMTGWERWRFCFGMMMAWLVLLRFPLEVIMGHQMLMSDQYLLALGGCCFSLWWIPRERGLPVRPSEYELGYKAGLEAKKEKA